MDLIELKMLSLMSCLRVPLAFKISTKYWRKERDRRERKFNFQMPLVHDSSSYRECHLLSHTLETKREQICGEPSILQQWHLNYLQRLNMSRISNTTSPEAGGDVVWFLKISRVLTVNRLISCGIRNNKTDVRVQMLIILIYNKIRTEMAWKTQWS